MKNLIVVLAIVLLAGVAWAAEIPTMVNTGLNTTYLTDGGTDITSITTNIPTWSGSTSLQVAEGNILMASTQQFESNPKRRIIKVYVVDPNLNIPLDKCILYQSEEYLTDLTDQEIFFSLKFNIKKGDDLNIQDFLAQYNNQRVKYLDKKLSRETGRDVYLEPVKIRELKMVIVNIAMF